MGHEYTGPLAAHIKGLVAEKKATGYSYVSAESTLRRFDAFMARSYPDATTVTPEIAHFWTCRLETECAASLHNRMKPVRQLALYMNRMGTDAYVLRYDDLPKLERPKQHIFTKQELTLFFEAADAYPSCGRNPNRNAVVPAIFRTIYCCGLRPCEAMRLKVADVGAADGSIAIFQAKGDKDRVVYASDDLRSMLECYGKKISAAMPGRTAFFPNWSGDHIAIKNIENWFNELWFSLPDAICRSQRKPSLQSFRHTFACERIRLWSHEGKDLRSAIYYLSEYMGHDSFRETEYYLHLLPEGFPDLLGKAEAISDMLLPEVV
jgi:integrase